MASVIDSIPKTTVTVPKIVQNEPNGELPKQLLRTFDGKGAMLPLASYGMQAMHLAASREGIALRTTGRYRSLERQTEVFQERYTQDNTGRPSKLWKGERWFLKPGMVRVATPGTSNHGRGLADDLATANGAGKIASIGDRELLWLRDNAEQFGFGLEARDEPWHWHWIARDSLPPRAAKELAAAGITVDLASGAADEGRPAGFAGVAATQLTPAPPPTIAEGSTDAHVVRWLQQVMVEHGWYTGPVDGTFDGDVTDAVKRMQHQLGLFDDGEYGPKTGGALERFIKQH